MTDFNDFAKLAIALKPWRQQIVFVGGWAYRLFRQHPLALPPQYQSVFTRDADVAFPERAPLEGDIREALINAGFRENFYGEFRPPVAQYALGDNDKGFYAEFLTPLYGSGTKRGGGLDATLEKAGVTAQKLRHLEILLASPWEVTIGKGVEGIEEEIPALQIPNPVSFIIQKILIHGNRPPDKRAQDVLYIHDTIELFGSHLPILAAVWKELAADTLTDKQRRAVPEGAKEIFSSVTDTLRDAARIPQDRNLEPEYMQMLCEQALDEMLN